MSDPTWIEVFWTLTSVAGIWTTIRLSLRAQRLVRTAERWVAEPNLTQAERYDAEAALVITQDRRERSLALVAVQIIFLAVGIIALVHSRANMTAVAQSAAQIGLIIAQVLLVVSAWRSVRAGEEVVRRIGKRTFNTPDLEQP